MILNWLIIIIRTLEDIEHKGKRTIEFTALNANNKYKLNQIYTIQFLTEVDPRYKEEK